ncbi:hypothetical protein DVH24_038431 [Malus domestica]|uniref:Uncharacterized protein n=1 Tax=Malus domestica TaxID=3750 RepID=A0A498KA22_MALDO|nr:hypothetical protein DVH24_038431 [Malus domestica]
MYTENRKQTKEDKDCDICDVGITDNALPVNHHPFTKSTAFLLCVVCRERAFLLNNWRYYGGGTASLNVTVAASIVLHQFVVSLVKSNFSQSTCEASETLILCFIRHKQFFSINMFVVSLVRLLFNNGGCEGFDSLEDK